MLTSNFLPPAILVALQFGSELRPVPQLFNFLDDLGGSNRRRSVFYMRRFHGKIDCRFDALHFIKPFLYAGSTRGACHS